MSDDNTYAVGDLVLVEWLDATGYINGDSSIHTLAHGRNVGVVYADTDEKLHLVSGWYMVDGKPNFIESDGTIIPKSFLPRSGVSVTVIKKGFLEV